MRNGTELVKGRLENMEEKKKQEEIFEERREEKRERVDWGDIPKRVGSGPAGPPISPVLVFISRSDSFC